MPTHLIYEAWLKTKDAEGNIKQNTRDAKGNEIIRDIKFSDPIEHKDIEEHDGCCYLCGEVMSKGIKVKKVFSGRFTDWNSGNSRHSSHVCPSCSFCVLTSPTKSSLRMFSHVANKDKLHLTNRIELRDYLLKPPEPPFVINLAVSQKKHIAFKGEVNYSQGIFTVMYEEMPVIVNRKEFKRLLDLVEHFLYGFTKTEISSGNYNQKRILDFGIEEWQEFEERIKKIRGTPLLDVVMFVAQKIESKEELKCFMASELKMNMQEQRHYSSMQSIEAGTKDEDQVESTCGDKLNDLQKSAPKGHIQLELF